MKELHYARSVMAYHRTMFWYSYLIFTCPGSNFPLQLSIGSGNPVTLNKNKLIKKCLYRCSFRVRYDVSNSVFFDGTA